MLVTDSKKFEKLGKHLNWQVDSTQDSAFSCLTLDCFAAILSDVGACGWIRLARDCDFVVALPMTRSSPPNSVARILDVE